MRVTRNGKLIRMAMGLSHNRANKSAKQLQRRRGERTLSCNKIRRTIMHKYL